MVFTFVVFFFWRRYNAEYTDLCAPLEIERIEWATRMAPNDGLMKFHQAADADGFVPDMSANTKITKIYLQLKVVTRPANAVFEFSCLYNSNSDKYTVYVSGFVITSLPVLVVVAILVGINHYAIRITFNSATAKFVAI